MNVVSFFSRFNLKAYGVLAGGLLAAVTPLSQAFTPSTAPAETQSVPGNMLLALSVEFPTGLQVSYTSTTYDTTVTTYYEGYFDNKKCYTYDTTNQLFVPATNRPTSGAGHGTCTSSYWSGNVLNWLTMTNLDQFRSVMTGGTRDNFSDMNASNPGDDASRTVLIRSFSDRNSYNPDKTLPAAAQGVPVGAGLTARSGGYGSKFFINSVAFPAMADNNARKAKCTSGTNGTSCFNIRVEVCNSTAGLESNCVGPYGTSPNTYYKPQGLIQEYSNSIRFGAMGYLNESGQSRNGGVLRARMKSVGASLIGQGGGSNSAKEWDANTGFLFTNPDAADATATNTLVSGAGVTKSGVINYLNQFGYTSGYKGNDPVGELYYASQLYFRNMSFPSNYTSSATVAGVDGFPVITSFSDPIIKTCQKNFILGIGDIYTHCDGNLPGASTNTKGSAYNTGTCGTSFPTDSSVNVESLWSSITSMEGSSSWTGGSTQGTAFMSGLAWWANTNDIRSDLAGKQSIATYWVDVLENNNGGSGIAAKSQYWLATKYGGFRQELLASGSDPNTNRLSWDKQTSGQTGYNQPDTLFAGSTPTLLKSSLRAAFDDILSRSQDSSASSAAVTSNRQTSNSQIIYAGYSPKDWTGSVSSCGPTQSAAQCQSSPVWEASRWFDTTYTAGATPKLNNTNRKIFTSWLSGSTFTEMPFLWNSLNTSQQTILNSTDSLGSKRVDYLRGSRADETSLFRVRGAALMGDVANSNVTYLAGPGPLYPGSNFSGHQTYRTANASRPPVVYVGANDGMLHAFDGSNGKELWAYIPGSVFANLPALTNPSFSHKYFVDGTAMVADTQTGNSSTPWRTMLVGGLGGGGKGYFALDVSKQTTSSGVDFSTMTESELANIPMWEFTSTQDSDLGYTYNEPSIDPVTGSFQQIAKVADTSSASGAWRIVVGNGYGSSANKAALLFLDSETGSASTKLVASTSLSPDNGLSSPAPVDTDGDGLVDTVYAGDLQGKLHKFQFSKLATNGTDYVVANSGDSNGAWRYIGVLYDAGAPITAAPVVTRSCSGFTGWTVLFGTGKLVEDSDFTNTSTNSFYSVVDSNVSSSLTVPSSLIATITYTSSTVSQGNIRSWTAPDLSGKKGWKISFTGGERIISNPTIPPDTGSVLFGTAKPSGDLCDPGSAGFLMAVNICKASTGDMIMTAADGTMITVGGFGVSASGILKVSTTYTNSGNKQQVVCNQADCQGGAPSGCVGSACTCTGSCVNGTCVVGTGTCPAAVGGKGATFNSSVAPRGRYSWRELMSR